MLDFHCHLLPGIDDGSDSVETSVKMLQMLGEQGVTQVVAAPHYFAAEADKTEAFLQRRAESLAAVAGLVTAPQIIPGAEVAYFDGMGFCDSLKKLTVGKTNLILVEMPFYDWNRRMVDEVVQLKWQLGLQPVLAHIERYRDRKQLPKFLKIFEENRIEMQCNANAFLRADTRRWALNMVKLGYVQFLGTDAHNLTGRAPNYTEALAVLQKKMPPKIVEHITEEL